MANPTDQIIANHMSRSGLHLIELINNILDAIAAKYKVAVEEDIKQLHEKIYNAKMPWSEELIKIQQKIMKDKRLDDKTKEIASRIITEEYNREIHSPDRKNMNTLQEYKELRRTFNKSKMPRLSKKIMHEILDKASQEQRDPCTIPVPRSSLRKMNALLKSKNLDTQVEGLMTVGGDTCIYMFNASIAPWIEQMTEMADIQRGMLPRPSLEDIQVYTQLVGDKEHPGQIITFQGLSPELAEKAIMLKEKTSAFGFAKTQRPDGLYDLHCFGGTEDGEKQYYYKQAVTALCQAAFSLTGPTRDLENAKAMHSAKEYDSIEKVLEAIRNDTPDVEDSGYVFSIQHFTDEETNNRFVLTDDYIQFGPEEFTSYHNGGHHLVSEEDSLDYIETLKLNIQSGFGQKVYISDSRMQELYEQGNKAFDIIEDLPVTDRLEQIAYLTKETDSLYAKLKELDDNIRSASSEDLETKYKNERAAVVEEFNVYTIARDTLLFDPNKTPTFEDAIQRAIGRELQKAEFKGYANANLTKEMVDDANICGKAMGKYLKNSPEIKELNVESASIYDVMDVLRHANYTDYINNMMAEIQPVGSDGSHEGPTIEDVKRHQAALENNYASRIKEAADLMAGITMEIAPVHEQASREAAQKNTKNLHAKFWKIGQKLLQKYGQENTQEYVQEPEQRTQDYDRFQ